jgi:hypothetical protein
MAACSAPPTEDGVVRPFDEIAATGPEVEVDPSGTFAVIRVTTTIEAVCAVSYGPGPELGMIATDQDMGGGGHSDHQPVLDRLTPGRTYSYRLQGIGPDGTLYRSELLTFQTPSAPTNDALGPNIAPQAQIVEVSSEFSASFSADNAIDGDPTTEWSSAGDGDGAFIVIGLAADTAVTGIGYRSRSMSDGTALTTSFTVTIDDATTLGPFDAGAGLVVVEAPFQGRIIRIDVETSTGGNTGAVEIEIYAAP